MVCFMSDDLNKWYIIRNVKPPIYIGLSASRARKIMGIISAAIGIAILSLVIAEPLGLVPPGSSMILVFIAFLIQGLLSLIPSIRRGGPSRTDILYVRGLLETLNGLISKWSIPSNKVLVAAILRNGLYLYITYQQLYSSKLVILAVKPTIYLRIISSNGRELSKYKIFKKRKVGNYIVGIIEATLPHPEIRNTYMYFRGKALLIPEGIEHKKVLSEIINFGKKPGVYYNDLYITYR
jgi:hypothetical protein